MKIRTMTTEEILLKRELGFKVRFGKGVAYIAKTRDAKEWNPLAWTKVRIKKECTLFN